ncbi:hypothetical protein [Curvibacter fontanus]
MNHQIDVSSSTAQAEPVEAQRPPQGERIFSLPIRVYWEDTDTSVL